MRQNMIDPKQEALEGLLDRLSAGQLGRRGFLAAIAAMGLGALVDPAGAARAAVAGETQAANRRVLKSGYDYIVVGAGVAGCLSAARLAEAGADVLLVESGGTDDLPQVSTPGIWFTNIGGPLDWKFKAEP